MEVLCTLFISAHEDRFVKKSAGIGFFAMIMHSKVCSNALISVHFWKPFLNRAFV